MNRKLFILAFAFNVMISCAEALPDPAQDLRVQKVYDYIHDQHIWIKNGEWTACARTLLDALSHVDQEGLWKEDYQPFLKALESKSLESPEAQKAADQLLTLAALNYISDMKGERLKPHSVDSNIHVKDVVIDEAELLKSYVSLTDHCGWIHSLAPSTAEYQHLKQALAIYRQKQAEGGWPQLPQGTKLEKGDQGPLVETLKAQLVAQDSLSSDEQASDIFDEKLEETLKNYQTLHGLEVDGKVGPTTLAALNTSVEEKIKAIIVSMEEQRWLPSPLPSRYVLVNIPGFYLKAVSNGEPVFFMPIITGKEYRKTPVFNTKMIEVIFNPAWHVPASIIGEILPKMEKNPEAYARKGYYMSEGRLIQRPGNGNSLGKIKFMIENPYGVYLHGTPSVHLFEKAKRAFSHGCIRVEDPYKLAEFVLHDPEQWSVKHIRSEASGTKTKPVKLDSPLPTFITYSTVFEGENQKIHFVDDTYGFDKDIWKALEEAKRRY